MDTRFSEIKRLIKEINQNRSIEKGEEDSTHEVSSFKQKEMILRDPSTGEEKRVRNFNEDGTFNPIDFTDEADKFHKRGKYSDKK